MSSVKTPIGPKVVSSDGTCVLIFSPPGARQQLEITQVSVVCDGSASSDCTLYVSNQVVCATRTGNGDSADGDPPIILTDAEELQLVWRDATPGANCSAVIFYNGIELKAYAIR